MNEMTTKFMRVIHIIALCITAIVAFPAFAVVPELAPLRDNSNGLPIRDDQGRVKYLVHLTTTAQDGYSDTIDAAQANRFREWHSAKAKNMVIDYERRYGLIAVDMTSHVANSFTAYLEPSQVDTLRADPHVLMVTALSLNRLSAPPWYDSTVSGETYSWGRQAVNAPSSNGNNLSRIYVLDDGVGYHEDLPNVYRVNTGPGATHPGFTDCHSHNTPCSGLEVVGCYPHATHIAGIIGAQYQNGKGVAGVDASATIISVDFNYVNASVSGAFGGPLPCSEQLYNDDSSAAAAMDFAKWDIYVNSGGYVGIINISSESSGYLPGNSLYSMLIDLATPQYLGSGMWYPGAFIAKSAGNQHDDACNISFGYNDSGTHHAHTNDGIMVVGGVDYQGNAVIPGPGGSDGYVNQPRAGNEQGSNYGPCVDVWAPSQLIYSTWSFGTTIYGQTVQSSGVTYSDYAYLSGTSMAAPFIAGVAAVLNDSGLYSTPAALETAIRNRFFNASTYDDSSLLINMVQLP